MTVTDTTPGGGAASSSAPLLEVSDLEVEFRTRDGQAIPTSFTCARLELAEGEAPGVVGVATDLREAAGRYDA